MKKYKSGKSNNDEVYIVTTKTAYHAFYSGYPEGRPEQEFTPSHLGIYQGERVGIYKSSAESLVDFIGEDGKQWRVALHFKDLVFVKSESLIFTSGSSKHWVELEFDGHLWRSQFDEDGYYGLRSWDHLKVWY